MEEENQRELQLLPSHQNPISSSTPSSSRISFIRPPESSTLYRSTMADPYGGPSLDLQLSISVVRPAPISELSNQEGKKIDMMSSIETLKWQAAEQIRMAAREKAYAERVRELTRREMELAQSEFERARQMWQKARDEVEKAERMKEKATRKIDSTCMEITCQSCRQRFKP